MPEKCQKRAWRLNASASNSFKAGGIVVSSEKNQRSQHVRLIMPATAAPMMGASQNNQSCAIYVPPANSAGPVLRAGLTEALVTGMRKR